jgi:AraC family transcriptional regulator
MGHDDITFSVVRKVQPAGYRFATNGYDMAHLIYVTEGRLYHDGHKGEPESEIGPGLFLLLRKGGAFTLSCRDAGYRGMGVQVRGTLPSPLRGEPLQGVADNRLRLMLDMALRHMDAPLPESARVLQGLSQALVWETLALTRERRSSTERRDWSSAVRTALDLNLGTGIPVREALTALPLSYRQLGRCFRERYGTSPKVYQELRRIDEAQRMLSETRMDITTIALELGYSSSQHFGAQFRRLTGSTPTQYRKNGLMRSRAEPIRQNP